MGLRARLGFVLFVLYVTSFITLPLGLLAERFGVLLGLVLSATFLLSLRYHGLDRVLRRMKAQKIAKAQSPVVFAQVKEFARRLNIPMPQVARIDSPAINVAMAAFSSHESCLIVTRGALDKLSREELAALMGRQVTYLWGGEVTNATWLSQFLSCMDQLVSAGFQHHMLHTRRFYPFRVFLRQILLYPLTLLPAFLLRGAQEPLDLDTKAVRLTRSPHGLGEAYRKLEALQERFPLAVPFSVRHLFLLPPPTLDPLGRLFFDAEPLLPRIQTLARMATNVSLSS